MEISEKAQHTFAKILVVLAITISVVSLWISIKGANAATSQSAYDSGVILTGIRKETLPSGLVCVHFENGKSLQSSSCDWVGYHKALAQCRAKSLARRTKTETIFPAIEGECDKVVVNY
jgi:hypothetical protein